MKVQWPKEYPGVHWINAQEEKAVLDVLRNKAPYRFYGLNKPKYVKRLEAQARKYYGVSHVQAVNSGTGALMTAMTALGIGPGCEVIVPSFMWVATIGAVVQANAIPVFCEVNGSFTMSPKDLKKKITSNTKLIIPVHMAGAPCNMQKIMAIAEKHQIPVMEDCAQSNGGSFQGQKVGTFGAMGVFSFQINKNVTAGEGGLLVTNDPRLFDRCNAAHDLGVPWEGEEPTFQKPEAITWGSGRRMNELTGAMASVQLRKLPRILCAMKASKSRILEPLRECAALTLRTLNDAEGDTGNFIIFSVTNDLLAKQAVRRMRTCGLKSACRLADYGMHIYYNIPQLVNRVPLSAAGNPWNLKKNRALGHDYHKGACPKSDALFDRSIIVPIPSKLTLSQERAAAEIICWAVTE